MKNDYSFKLVVAIIVAGVLVALVSPSPKAQDIGSASIEATQTANHAE